MLAWVHLVGDRLLLIEKSHPRRGLLRRRGIVCILWSGRCSSGAVLQRGVIMMMTRSLEGSRSGCDVNLGGKISSIAFESTVHLPHYP